MAEPADALVFFGATGDLAHKMIFPSLYRLAKSGRLAIPVIGVALAGWDLARLQARAEESVTTYGGGIDDRPAFDHLMGLLRYVDGDYASDDTFERLRTELGAAQRPVHYLAIPPSLFALVVHQLDSSGCVRDGRVVVEKPFGRDLASAQELNVSLRKVFPEASVCRIDHFLGEEAIQDAAYIRMLNSPIGALFDRNHVARVQLTFAEDFGVEDRGSFYDSVGCLLDVVQNHLLQIIALLAMDPPSVHAPDAMRAEQARLLGAIRPLAAADLVRGQHEGYHDIDGVAAGSDTETYVALRMFIDTPRWAGVPFYIRAGKHLPVTVTEAVIEFAEPAVNPYPQLPVPPGRSHLRIRFHPEQEVVMRLRTLDPGGETPTTARELMLNQREPDAQTPYERLLGAAIEGEMQVFVREDAVEASWRVVEPVLHTRPPCLLYRKGSWGPPAADLLCGDEGWHSPV